MARKPKIHRAAPAAVGTKFGAVKNKGNRTSRSANALTHAGSVFNLAVGVGAMSPTLLAAGAAGLAYAKSGLKKDAAKIARNTAVENLIRRGKTGNTLGASGLVERTITVQGKNGPYQQTRKMKAD